MTLSWKAPSWKLMEMSPPIWWNVCQWREKEVICWACMCELLVSDTSSAERRLERARSHMHTEQRGAECWSAHEQISASWDVKTAPFVEFDAFMFQTGKRHFVKQLFHLDIHVTFYLQLAGGYTFYGSLILGGHILFTCSFCCYSVVYILLWAFL